MYIIAKGCEFLSDFPEQEWTDYPSLARVFHNETLAHIVSFTHVGSRVLPLIPIRLDSYREEKTCEHVLFRSNGFLALVLMFLLAACSGGGSDSTGTTPPPPPPPPPTLTAPTIVQQPNSQTAIAGNPATFSIAATGTGPLSYSWTLKSSGQSQTVGSNSPSVTLMQTTTDMSGSQLTAAVSNQVGAVDSTPASLTVLQPSNIPTPNPVLVGSTPFPIFTGVPQTRTYALSLPAIPAGELVICFLWQGQQAQMVTLETAANVVTDSSNDTFKLLGFTTPDAANGTGVTAYCFGAQTAGGSNITATVDVQVVNGQVFSGTALMYTGLSGTVDNTLNTDGTIPAGDGNGTTVDGGTIVSNVPGELVISMVNTGAFSSVQSTGTPWTVLFQPLVSGQDIFIIESTTAGSGSLESTYAMQEGSFVNEYSVVTFGIY
jgi:hypothetical protein